MEFPVKQGFMSCCFPLGCGLAALPWKQYDLYSGIVGIGPDRVIPCRPFVALGITYK